MHQLVALFTLLAAHVASKPVYDHHIRQATVTDTSSAAALVTPAPDDASVLASNDSTAAVPADGIALAAATVIDEGTTCSLTSQTAYTTTSILTAGDLTTAIYSLTLTPTIGCRCFALLVIDQDA